MGIDRIGKGGTPPAPEVGSADKANKTGAVDKPFAVERTKQATPVDTTQATSPLSQLKAGKIDVEQYLDLRVDEATKSLDKMPATQLADLKKLLREQIATDPTLIDLVRTATGKVPKPPETE